MNKDVVPTCHYGVDTEKLAGVYTQLDWCLKSQDCHTLAFTLEKDVLEAFPDRRISQIINLHDPHARIDKTKMFKHTLDLTPEFVGKELTLSSALCNPEGFNDPNLDRQVRDLNKPKNTFMLLPFAQFNELADSGELNNVMKAQAAFNDDERTWHLDPNDEYWLMLKSNFELMTECGWHDQPTFRFEGAVVAADLQGPIKHGEKNIVRVQRNTVVAAGGNSTTWTCCMDADSSEALPLVKTRDGKSKTQVWGHLFTVRQVPKQVEEVRTVYNLEETCPICLDTYGQFSVLTCKHALCAKCKDDVADARKNVKCPFCLEDSSASNIVTVDLTVD